MFDAFLYNLREQGLKVGMSEWLRFLQALQKGLATNLDDLYPLARAVLVHTEAHYDLYDVAFLATFKGIAADPKLVKDFEAWLQKLQEMDPERPPGEWNFENFEDMMEALRKTLEAQQGQHHGGNRWVGTGGTSPWGTGGRANQGVQLGESGGGRSGVRLADSRRWQNYRTDQTLGVRDFKVALRALRKLAKDGEEMLDLDGTIDKTAKNAGEIDLVFGKEKKNRVHLVLLMDSGGSMTPNAELVSRLFTAAKETKTFKTFEHYFFHNAIYQYLYTDFENWEREKTSDVLNRLTDRHRLIFVGDASMAPWELFTKASGIGQAAPSGLDWFTAFKRKCPASVWLNPDPERWWNHPTVSAIGNVMPMHRLTLDGLRDAIRYLKAPT